MNELARFGDNNLIYVYYLDSNNKCYCEAFLRLTDAAYAMMKPNHTIIKAYIKYEKGRENIYESLIKEISKQKQMFEEYNSYIKQQQKEKQKIIDSKKGLFENFI